MLKWINLSYFILLFTIPLSVTLSAGPHAVEAPGELLMIVIFMFIGLHLYKTGFHGLTFLNHPLTFIGALWTMWMAVGVIAAYDPLVTIKYTSVSFVQWVVFFLGMGLLNIHISNFVERWYNFYLVPLMLVLLLAFYTFSKYDFAIGASVLVARPFFFDHTYLSACLSILVGIYAAKAVIEWKLKSGLSRLIYTAIFIVLVIAVITLFSRAAWLSLVISFIIILFLIFFKRNRILTMVVSVFATALVLFYISAGLENKSQIHARSYTGKWAEHIGTIANLEDNASNLERLNRYKCAYRMFQDRPILGFGAGSFPIAFLPYQKPDEMTRISVTTIGPHPPGRGGSTHSEYLRALSEMGLPGLFLFLSLLFYTYRTGSRIYFRSNVHQHRIYALGILFGISTFFVHGLFNNFLHQEKFAVLFWSSLMFLVLIDKQDRKSDANNLT